MSLTPRKKQGLKHTLIWTGVTLFGVLFMSVYYALSHHVYSIFITLVWLPPLVLSLIYLIVLFWKEVDIGEWARFGLGAGVATLMVFQALEGIYEIAQVKFENSIDVRLAYGFLIVAILMLIYGVTMTYVYLTKKKEE